MHIHGYIDDDDAHTPCVITDENVLRYVMYIGHVTANNTC